jgi:probable phosphomutase (TIGR03848 family)
VTTVILLRHGRSSSNTAGVLAGRSEGVELDDKGREQAAAVVERLVPLPLVEIVTSPQQRCRQTVEPLAAARGMDPCVDPALAEVDYGDWTGLEIKTLAKRPLWKVVQQHPSAAIFPGGEGLAAVQARAVAAVRGHGERLGAAHGPFAIWVACTHGDVIKAVLADALGMHLDAFQRIVVEPGSISVVAYTETRPFVARVNDVGGDLTALVPPKPRRRRRRKAGDPAGEGTPAAPSSDAVVGGSTN